MRSTDIWHIYILKATMPSYILENLVSPAAPTATVGTFLLNKLGYTYQHLCYAARLCGCCESAEQKNIIGTLFKILRTLEQVCRA